MVTLPRINIPAPADGVAVSSVTIEQPAIQLDNVKAILENINKSIENMAFSLNMKLGSIAMMMSDFFKYQIDNAAREKIVNDDQVKKPPKLEDKNNGKNWSFPQIDQNAITGWLTTLLTGLGVAFLASRAGFDKAIQESGIFAFIAKGVAKGVMVATGISKIVSSISSNGVIASLGTMIGKIFGAFNSAAKMIVPFYAQALAIGKGVGKLIPFIAIATTLVDFLRGFSQGEGALDGIKKGLMEVAAGWIGWPLNILKNIVGWVAGKLGFENIKNSLGEVDFIKPVKDLVAIAFDTITNIFTFDTERFGEVGYWKQKVFDLLYSPVDIGVNFIKKVFAIGDLENPFRMSDFIASVVQKANELVAQIYNFDYAGAFSEGLAATMAFFQEKSAQIWDSIKTNMSEVWDSASTTIKAKFTGMIDDVTQFFVDMFNNIKSYIPSVDDVVKKIVDALPSFMIPDSYIEPDRRIRELDESINEQKQLIERSNAGENVFWGPEDRGRGIAQAKIDEANRIKQEIMRERDKAANINAPTNVVIGGSTTNNASSVSYTQMSPLPSNGRPD